MEIRSNKTIEYYSATFQEDGGGHWKTQKYSVNQLLIETILAWVNSGAEILQRFGRDSTSPKQNVEKPTPPPEDFYCMADKLFIVDVWSQEKSLVTLGISKAVTDLPAVDLIERYLVPFECCSLGDLGFYGSIDDEPCRIVYSLQQRQTLDTSSPEYRIKLSKIIMRLFELWGLGKEDQAALLGLSTKSGTTLNRYRNGKPFANNTDLIDCG